MGGNDFKYCQLAGAVPVAFIEKLSSLLGDEWKSGPRYRGTKRAEKSVNGVHNERLLKQECKWPISIYRGKVISRWIASGNDVKVYIIMT